MEMADVPILVSCSCGGEHQRRMAVQSDIALADLIEEVEAEFECSRGIELRKMVSEDNWVRLKDPVNLKTKLELKAVKVCT